MRGAAAAALAALAALGGCATAEVHEYRRIVMGAECRILVAADEASVMRAVDQCADVGFEMLILSFGSGFDVENRAPDAIARLLPPAVCGSRMTCLGPGREGREFSCCVSHRWCTSFSSFGVCGTGSLMHGAHGFADGCIHAAT